MRTYPDTRQPDGSVHQRLVRCHPTRPNSTRLYLREKYLSHRVLGDYDAIVEACCHAWNQLTLERVQILCNYPDIQQVSL